MVHKVCLRIFFLKMVNFSRSLLSLSRVSQKKGDPCLMGHKGHQKWAKDKSRVSFEKFGKFPFPCLVYLRVRGGWVVMAYRILVSALGPFGFGARA